jgi:hypothetical protein
MKPTIENLAGTKGGTITVNVSPPRNGGTGLTSARESIVMSGGGTAITLADGSGADAGMWVQYIAGRGCFGIAAGGETWAASGPFSGCHIVVGKKDGSIYVAHLAQQSGSTADTDWSSRGWKDEVWGRWKVPIPSQTIAFTSSIVFVDWSKGASPSQISVVRMDVQHKAMGGFDAGAMKILDVAQVVAPV